jgi:Nucleoside H+ symporter
MPTYLESRGLPRAWVAMVMTLGQWPEIGTLAVLPGLIRRLDFKWTLALGIGSWVARYGSLALDPPLGVALASTPLHGVGIACFSVGGQIYLNSQAPAHRRAGAQALLMVLTSGIWTLLGSVLAGEVLDRFSGDYVTIFLVPCLIDLTLLA